MCVGASAFFLLHETAGGARRTTPAGVALVACALCTGISIEELARYVIDCYPECRFNPWRMLPSAESAMERFLPEDAALLAEGRLRVLLTRVLLRRCDRRRAHPLLALLVFDRCECACVCTR